MKTRKNIPLCNLLRAPGRTTALVLLSVLLSFTILAGSLAISGLQAGLSSLEARLGADIMVVPDEATTKSSFSNLILQGSTGYYYMDDDYLDRIRGLEGVQQASAQFYLASATSSCCSSKVQIIGYDPATDFTISPWINTRLDDDLGLLEIVVGNDLSLKVGSTFQVYGTVLKVVSKMDRTGTYLDSSVYMSTETVQYIVQYATDNKIYKFGNMDPYGTVSCVLIDVEDGYDVESVANEINGHMRGVTAVQTKTLVSDVASGMSGVSRMIGGLIAVIWILAVFILVLAFTMISNERKKEFAIYRVLGASRKMLSGILFREAFLVSLVGSVIGAALAAAVMAMFGNLLEDSLGLPFLMPGIAGIIGLFVAAIVVSILTGALAAAHSAHRISQMDTALILRKGE